MRLETDLRTGSLRLLVWSAQPWALDRIIEPNTRFKTCISLFSLAAITIAAILLTLFVMKHEHVEAGTQALFLFALILFGPVSLFFLVVLNSGWPIAIQAVLLLSVTPLILAATFWRSRYTDKLRPLACFLWGLCSLMLAGSFI